MSPKICVAVTAETMAELRARRDRVTGADLVELRVDTVRDPSAAGALQGRKGPVIVTCRAAWEGGHFRGSEEERLRLLADAQALGAEYIDVEAKADHGALVQRTAGRGVVLSMHDFDGIPDDLLERVRDMRASGAEIVKVAVMAHRLADCLSLLRLSDANGPAMVKIAMGDAGLVTRALPHRFGSAWTYAGDGVAPGQIPAARLRDEFSFDRVTVRTALFGVVGRPVMHSVSPAMHNAAFRARGIDAVYLPLAAETFDDFLAFADAFDVKGASVTAPFKLDAFAHATDVDGIAERIGAVNTLRRDGAKWSGRNTDVDGFLAPLISRSSVGGRRVTVLGAGGAARAAIEALRRAGARVTICARRHDRASELARLGDAAVDSWPPAPGSWDVLINTTPVGTMPHVDDSPLPEGAFGGELVYDLVYNPPDTRLLRDARAAGCTTIGGLDMLIAQAQLQFEWWTGQPAPDDVMRNAALAALRTTALAPEALEAPNAL